MTTYSATKKIKILLKIMHINLIEMKATIKCMNSKTTPDENFIFNKCLNYLPDTVLNYIVEIFNASLV